MYKRHVIGKEGEERAIEYLENNNYKIIEKNFQCKQGEIDIIAKDIKKDEYVFIEVKTRKSLEYGIPAEAVNEVKQKHILSSAKYYMYIHNLENKFVRFDVIQIYIKNCKFYINHLKNCEFKEMKINEYK